MKKAGFVSVCGRLLIPNMRTEHFCLFTVLAGIACVYYYEALKEREIKKRFRWLFLAVLFMGCAISGLFMVVIKGVRHANVSCQ